MTQKQKNTHTHILLGIMKSSSAPTASPVPSLDKLLHSPGNSALRNCTSTHSHQSLVLYAIPLSCSRAAPAVSSAFIGVAARTLTHLTFTSTQEPKFQPHTIALSYFPFSESARIRRQYWGGYVPGCPCSTFAGNEHPTEHEGETYEGKFGDVEVNTSKSGSQPSQSSWTAKDHEGNDYLYRLGKEADNMNITVGARRGMIDDLFVGDFLGKEADIVFTYRQKVTRSFEYLHGDYYIAPVFMDIVVTHIVKNYLAEQLQSKVPLILGVWGGKGQGKSFQTELIFKALGVEPVIMSAGELESERAGEPGKLIRERYRAASQVVKIRGKMSCLMINDLDAGIGRFENTQMTVNNQIVVATLMNLADNPTRVSIGQQWNASDVVNRIPIIVTGNDLSTIWAPLLRDGRMEKFYWQPTREDLINIVFHMYRKDGISKEDIARIIDTFPNQALDFYGALRSRTYDKHILKWVESVGGAEKLGELLLRKKKGLPAFNPPEQNIEDLIAAGHSLVEEQQMVMKMKLSEQYMKKQVGPGSSLLLAS